MGNINSYVSLRFFCTPVRKDVYSILEEYFRLFKDIFKVLFNPIFAYILAVIQVVPL